MKTVHSGYTLDTRRITNILQESQDLPITLEIVFVSICELQLDTHFFYYYLYFSILKVYNVSLQTCRTQTFPVKLVEQKINTVLEHQNFHRSKAWMRISSMYS